MKSQNPLIKFTDLPLDEFLEFQTNCEAMSQIDAIHNYLIKSGQTMSFGRNCPIKPTDLLELTSDIIDLINSKVNEYYEEVSKDSENNMDSD